MSVELYERYKEALRRGHVAAARGELEEAIAAYDEAIQLAPDRALPYVSAGSAQLGLGTPADAVAAFDAALARSPRDEAGLRGRADALARLGRRVEAADALDLLSDVHERAGRLADAVEAAQGALGLAEQKARRRHLQELTRRLRLSAPDQQAADVLDKALRVLELAEPPAAAAPSRAPATPGSGPAGEAAPTGAHALDAGLEAAAAATAAAEPETPTEHATTAEPLPDGSVLMSEAEAAIDAGDVVAARRTLLAAALAFEAHGLLSAALDACYLALELAPDDAQIHLELVELYLELGWDAPAADKLALLGRLAELDGLHSSTRARLVGLAADHFPDDPRLRHLSA
jgi:tetratricopeptide (TPR) repeat protein